MIIALQVPMHKDDFVWYNQPVPIPLNLPLFTQFTSIDDVDLVPIHEDFSSDIKIKGAEQQNFIKMDPSETNTSVVYDSKTGITTERDLNPDEIMKIIITRPGASFSNPSHLTDALE